MQFDTHLLALGLVMLLSKICTLVGELFKFVVEHRRRQRGILEQLHQGESKKFSCFLALKARKQSAKRKYWKKPGRTSAWWRAYKNNEVVESDWVENFRMSQSSFYELSDFLRPFLIKKITNMRRQICPEE